MIRPIAIAIFLVPHLAYSQAPNRFDGQSWSAAIPHDWKHSTQQAPNGSTMHMFTGPQMRNFMPYCHVTAEPINVSLTPRLGKMTQEEIREFFLKTSNLETFKLVYGAATTAPAFQLLRVYPSTLGVDRPAMGAEFSFAIPQGFHYRVQSSLTIANKSMYSIWCQSAARSHSDAERGYHLTLSEFQRFFAAFELKGKS